MSGTRERTLVELTVLGCDGSWPGPGGTGSSYLLTCDGFHLVLDLRGGALGRLQEQIGIADIGAVCVSHGHADHYAGLFPLSIARYWGGLGAPGRAPSRCARCREAMSIRSDRSPPRPSTWPMRALRWDSGCRRTASHIDGGEPDYHLTARQAARCASEAGVGCLVLTHIEPGVDPAVSPAQAREVFDGTILVAHPGLRIQPGAGRGASVRGARASGGSGGGTISWRGACPREAAPRSRACTLETHRARCESGVRGGRHEDEQKPG